MQTPNNYEEKAGQLINTDKSLFLVHSNVFNSTKDKIKGITCFKKSQGPLSYLLCPLFGGTLRFIYLSNLVNKVICRIRGRKIKQLSYGEGQF